MVQTIRRTGPYSRSAQLAKPKRRTRESRFLLQIRMDLTKHLGGSPNIAQTLMIDRIAMTLLRIELMDRDALESDTPGVLTERQSRDYLAWVNTAGLVHAAGNEALHHRAVTRLDNTLDNVLAVAGTARDHFWVLVVGLMLSVALMGAASTVVARILDRHQWLAWIGLAIVALVAFRMIYAGSFEVIRQI